MAAGNTGTGEKYAVNEQYSSGTMRLITDSIDFTSEYTRVYGKLIGQPHTSNRIDNVTLSVGNGSHNGIDIDGVDLNRWFQWEDDGVIPVEFDFPPVEKKDTFIIEVNGPRGDCRWVVESDSIKR